MDQWVEILSKFGLPVVGLIGAAYFLLRHVWPFVTRQIEEAQASRKAEIEKFVDTIRARDTLMAESQRLHLQALQEMTRELIALRETVLSHRSHQR